MTLSNSEHSGNAISASHSPPSAVRATIPKPVPIKPCVFFEQMAVLVDGGIQGAVTLGPSGQLTNHAWNTHGTNVSEFLANKTSGKKFACFTPPAYVADKVSQYKGRTEANILGLRAFWFDIEGSIEKGGYDGQRPVLVAVTKFVKASGLVPTHLVATGSGGMHTYFLLDETLPPAQWTSRAPLLVALAASHGLKIDVPVTVNNAQPLRAPGSIHQKTGLVVEAYRWRTDNYTLAEFDTAIGYTPGAEVMQTRGITSPGKYDLSVNGDIQGGHASYSYRLAAQRCGAMNQAAQHNGRDTPYGVWFLAVKAADLSTEGREFAHEISSGHPDYDEADTDRKIDSLTGGPASCRAWRDAYGPGGPCDTCDFKDTIKNPAVQLGTPTDTTPPGVVPQDQAETVPQWVADLNTRYGLVRTGSRMTVADFQTYSTGGRGVGWLDIAAFRQMLSGRLAPIDNPKDKARALADAYLSHLQRRQYEGLVFAPGETLPANVLNLWQGFAVEPAAGDVSPWLEVLTALVPNELERVYVLKWTAWKIQNPGGVPDTVLIFKGAKGTGKNSLFEPLITLFGRHAMLADDPELIAGRFTWHLMSLSLAVLDEAVFVGDPRQADRVKSRVTAKVMMYEQKGMDPVQGVNRCAYVMLTNHEYVWQATTDERRAVVIEVGERLREKLEFWERYHVWAYGAGPAALLHYLQGVDLTGFNPRQIPKGEALRKQVEQTALRIPAAAWWHQCLTEGAIRWRADSSDRVAYLDDAAETEVDRSILRMSFEQSAAGRGRGTGDWPAVSRKLMEWSANNIRTERPRVGGVRIYRDCLPPLPALRAGFTAATQVRVGD